MPKAKPRHKNESAAPPLSLTRLPARSKLTETTMSHRPADGSSDALSLSLRRPPSRSAFGAFRPAMPWEKEARIISAGNAKSSLRRIAASRLPTGLRGGGGVILCLYA